MRVGKVVDIMPYMNRRQTVVTLKKGRKQGDFASVLYEAMKTMKR